MWTIEVRNSMGSRGGERLRPEWPVVCWLLISGDSKGKTGLTRCGISQLASGSGSEGWVVGGSAVLKVPERGNGVRMLGSVEG